MRVPLFLCGSVLMALSVFVVQNPTLAAIGATILALPLYLDGHGRVQRPGPFLRLMDQAWHIVRAFMLWPFEVASAALDRATASTPAALPQSTCRHEGEPVPVVVTYPEMGLAPERTETVAYLCPKCREVVPAPFTPPIMALGSIAAEGPTGRTMILPEGVTYTPLGGQVEPGRAVHPRIRPRTRTWSKGGIVKGPGACSYCHTPHHRYDGTHRCQCAVCRGDATRVEGDSIDGFCSFCGEQGHASRNCDALDHVQPEERRDALQMLREDLAAKMEQIKALVASWEYDGGRFAMVASARNHDEYRKREAEANAIRRSIDALAAAPEPPPRNAVVSVDHEPEGTKCRHCGEPFEFEDVMAHGSHVPVRRIRRPHMCQVDVEDPETGEHLGEVRYIAVGGDWNRGHSNSRFDRPPRRLFDDGGPEFSDHDLRRTLFPPL